MHQPNGQRRGHEPDGRSRQLLVFLNNGAQVLLVFRKSDPVVSNTKTPLECAEFILSAIQFLTDMGIYPWTQKDLNRRLYTSLSEINRTAVASLPRFFSISR